MGESKPRTIRNLHKSTIGGPEKFINKHKCALWEDALIEGGLGVPRYIQVSRLLYRTYIYLKIDIPDIHRVCRTLMYSKTYKCVFGVLLLRACMDTKKVAKYIIGKNGSRDLYRSPNHQYGNHMSCPYGGPVVHRQKTPPNMGRLGCVCQVLSPKGHDFSFQYW